MDKFKNITAQLIEAIEQFTEIEQTKLDAAAAANLVALEDCMTKEQAMIMRVKGLEIERERWQTQNGYGGLTFRELLQRVKPEELQELQPLFEQLNSNIKMFEDISKSAEQIIKNNLYVVNRKLEQQGKAYNKDGSPDAAAEGRLTDSKA